MDTQIALEQDLNTFAARSKENKRLFAKYLSDTKVGGTNEGFDMGKEDIEHRR